MGSDLLKHYDKIPFLAEISESGTTKHIKKGTQLLSPGAYPHSVPLVLEGNLRVYTMDEEGKELLLYYLGPGDTCSLSLFAGFDQLKSLLGLVAEQDSKIFMVPLNKVDDLMKKHPGFFSFALVSLKKRFEKLLERVEDLAFHNLEERLLVYLQEKVKIGEGNELNISHQQIANDLHSSREVISRQLKKMEASGTVQLGRNKLIFIGA